MDRYRSDCGGVMRFPEKSCGLVLSAGGSGPPPARARGSPALPVWARGQKGPAQGQLLGLALAPPPSFSATSQVPVVKSPPPPFIPPKVLTSNSSLLRPLTSSLPGQCRPSPARSPRSLRSLPWPRLPLLSPPRRRSRAAARPAQSSSSAGALTRKTSLESVSWLSC